jgi:hypothetical protein
VISDLRFTICSNWPLTCTEVEFTAGKIFFERLKNFFPNVARWRSYRSSI